MASATLIPASQLLLSLGSCRPTMRCDPLFSRLMLEEQGETAAAGAPSCAPPWTRLPRLLKPRRRAASSFRLLPHDCGSRSRPAASTPR